ncbi:MAG TPA: hypothetical protein PKW15_05930 [Alphaproteobacteria bacterium]|nr:hypothetical protein [Alphaproteobacteria bacterium]
MTGKNLAVQKAQNQMLLQTTPLSAAVAPMKTSALLGKEQNPTPEIVFQAPSFMPSPRIAAAQTSPAVVESKPKPNKAEIAKITDKPVVKPEPADPIIAPPQEIQPRISRDLSEIQQYHPVGKIMPDTLYEFKVSHADFDIMPDIAKQLLEPYKADVGLKDQLDPAYPKQVIGILDYGDEIGILMNSRAVTAYLRILPKLNDAPGVDEAAKVTIQKICDAFTACPEKYAIATVIQPPQKETVNSPPIKSTKPQPAPLGH